MTSQAHTFFVIGAAFGAFVGTLAASMLIAVPLFNYSNAVGVVSLGAAVVCSIIVARRAFRWADRRLTEQHEALVREFERLSGRR